MIIIPGTLSTNCRWYFIFFSDELITLTEEMTSVCVCSIVSVTHANNKMMTEMMMKMMTMVMMTMMVTLLMIMIMAVTIFISEQEPIFVHQKVKFPKAW